MEIGSKIIVKGIVQGVGFRYFVFRVATRFGLKGYVKNLFNGDVEIDIEGDRSMIEELIKEIKIGPRSAHITDTVITWKEVDKHYKTIEIL